MEDIPMTAKIKVAPGVFMQQVSGESVILDSRDGRYFGLDPVGTRMWETLVSYGNLGQAEDALLDEYEVTPDRLHEDMVLLVRKLVERRLIELEE